jgi:hypothetical protein
VGNYSNCACIILPTLHVIAKILLCIQQLGIIVHHAINTMEIAWHGKGVLPGLPSKAPPVFLAPMSKDHGTKDRRGF